MNITKAAASFNQFFGIANQDTSIPPENIAPAAEPEREINETTETNSAVAKRSKTIRHCELMKLCT